MSIVPGNYLAKVQEGSYGIGESTKKQTLFVSVNLKILDNEKKVHIMQWSGFLSEKAIEITNKALAVMGMAVPDYEMIAKGQGLDYTKEFWATVVEETTDSGKIYSKVAWINENASGGKVALLDASSALTKLKGLGLTKTSTLPF